MSRGASAGSLRFDVVANSAQFVKAIRQARTRLQKFTNQAKQWGRQIARNWKSVGLAIGGLTASIGVAVKRMTDYSSKLVESARSAGMATKQLENMRALLKGDGIGIKQTDKAMQEFTTRLGFAQRGVGQYTRAFEAMGVSVRNQDGTIRNQNDVLIDVAKALQNTESHAEAASLAYEFFGRSGKELLPILQRYGAELIKAAEHAGRFRTLSDEQHKANKDLGQSVEDLTTNMSDLVDRGLALAAPHLTTIADEINRWISALKDNPGVMEGLKSFAEGLGTALAFAAKMIGTVIVGFGYMFKAVKTIAESVADLFTESFGEARDEYIKAAKALEDHQARGPLTLPGGRVTVPAQQVFDETTLALQAEVQRARSVFEAKQAVVRARNNEASVAAMVKELANPIQAAVAEGAEAGIVQGAKIAGETKTSPSIMAHQYTRQEMMRMKADYQTLLYEFESAAALKEQAFIHAMSDVQYRPMDQSGRRRFAAADNRSMASFYGLIAGGQWDPRLLGRGAFSGFIRKPEYRHLYNNGLGYMTSGGSSGASGGFPQPLVSVPMNHGLGYMSSGASSGAAGGFPQRTNRDQIVSIERMIWDASLNRVADTFQTRLAGAQSWWKGQLAAIKAVKEELAELLHIDKSGGGAGRTLGAQAWWRGQMAAIADPAGRADNGMTARWAREMRDYYSGERRIKEAMESMENVKDELDPMISIADNIRDSFSSMAGSMITNFDSMGDAARRFGLQLVEAFAQRQVIAPLTNALFGAAGSGFGGVFGGFLGNIFGGGGGSAASVFAQGRANGGMAHGLTLVGERGPELVDFSKPGMVTSNERIRAALGMSGGVTINYTINSTDGPGVKRALANATPFIVNAAQSAVADSSRRPGAFRDAVRGAN